MAHIEATVIFDNGGGTTIQLRDGALAWAHYYSDTAHAAGDVREALQNGFGAFDGDEPEAAVLRPTAEEIRNGGYRIEQFGSIEDLSDHARGNFNSSWRNERDFARDTLKRML